MATTSEQVTRSRIADPLAVRVYLGLVFVSFLALTAVGHHFQGPGASGSVGTLAAWALIAAVADTLRVRLWDDFSFAMSLPVTLAAGMVLSPTDAAVVAFVGAFDLKDFSGRIPIERVLGNRAMAGLSILAGSSAFHAMGFSLTDWPQVLLASVVAYSVDFGVNVALVTFPVARLQGVAPRQVLTRLLEPTPSQAALIYGCVGLLSPVVALVSASVGVFGVAVLLLPLGLARNAYLQALRLHEAAQRLHEKNRALRTAAQEASQGRKEERLILASELKNDVLPSLARVHLMGQVLKQDLLHGRLLQIDDDLPALLEATDAAHSVLKGVMQGLEGSPLGIGGVSSALRVLADQRESTSPHVRIRLELEDVVGSDAALHAVYEAAKEAIDNAVAHAHSSQIEVRMVAVEGRIRLVVGDNGIGFSPRDAYLRGHTGLVKMREIVESVGGDVVVVSTRGEGTLVVVAIPVDA